ncbi:MAG: hypothetical protein LBJ01_06600 [Tannerella sp.]|jgi:hypothetical protein|nr:hypothetical protein [Tannerella sp.]
MTAGERLNGKLKGLVKDIDGILVDRGLNGADTYTPETGKSASFNLAYADGLFQLLTDPNVSQGDWSRSWGDRSSLERVISGICSRFAPDENPFPNAISSITDRW